MKKLNLNEVQFPFFLVWEITNKCNSKCIHCYNNSGLPRKQELSRESIAKVCDEIISNKVLRVDVIGGEPLISEHFDYITDRLKNFVSLTLITNGICLKNTKILRNYSQIQVSLDGLSADYSAARGVNKFPAVKSNLKKLIAIKGPEIIASITLTKLNLSKISKIIEFCIENKIKHIKLSEFIPLGRGYSQKQRLEPDAKEYAKIKALIKKYSGKCRFEWESVPKLNSNSQIMPINKNWLCISSEGEIMPDPFIPLSIGNVKDISIEKAWNAGKNSKRLTFSTILNNEEKDKILSFNKLLRCDLFTK